MAKAFCEEDQCKTIPPTLEQHVKRAVYQARYVWGHSLINSKSCAAFFNKLGLDEDCRRNVMEFGIIELQKTSTFRLEDGSCLRTLTREITVVTKRLLLGVLIRRR